MAQKIMEINATNLPDAWFQTVYAMIEHGRNFTVDRGSFEGQQRREFDYAIIHIKVPGVGELLPKLNPVWPLPDPVAAEYLDDYLPYIMTGEEKVGESYTYGQRICKAPFDFINKTDENLHVRGNFYHDRDIIIRQSNNEYFLNQMGMMIWTYKNKGHRNNQMVLQVGQPTDMLLKDPPCLRHIDTRIQDGKLHFYPYFRSWDLWGGFPANLAAIELMKQYCAAEIGVENGEIIATSKGLHLYDYVWELAEILRTRTMDEFRKELILN